MSDSIAQVAAASRVAAPPPGARLDASVIKRISGGPPYPVRGLFQKPIEVRFKGLVIASFNSTRRGQQP
jgi:phage/plasmid-associated DNA primase